MTELAIIEGVPFPTHEFNVSVSTDVEDVYSTISMSQKNSRVVGQEIEGVVKTRRKPDCISQQPDFFLVVTKDEKIAIDGPLLSFGVNEFNTGWAISFKGTAVEKEERT